MNVSNSPHERARRKVIPLDGGMGQELVRRAGGAAHPLWSAKVMIDRPDIVEAVHREFIEAGARIITVNAYSATPERLERHGLKDKFRHLQNRALDLAQSARDKARAAHAVRIAGCLPPLFGTYHPEAAPDFDECLTRYREIVDAQTNNVDLFLCETLSSLKEARAAATAALESSKEVWVSVTLDDKKPECLRSGENAAGAFRSIGDLGVSASLVNCSAPETISAEIERLTGAFPNIGAYGNGFVSIDALNVGGTVDVLSSRQDLNPAQYAKFAIEWAEAGAKIVGGCCEIGPAHIRTMCECLLDSNFDLVSELY